MYLVFFCPHLPARSEMILYDSLRCKGVMFKIVTKDTTPTSILLVVTVIVEATPFSRSFVFG